MAKNLETLRSSGQDSIKGRKLTLDPSGYLVGPPGFPQPVTDLTSGSTATTILSYGVTNLQLSTAATSAAGGAFLIGPPVYGVSVTIINGYTSTGGLGSTAATVLRNAATFNFVSSEGTTMTTIVMSSQGYVTLTGVSSAVWQATSRVGTSMVSMNGTT